MLRGETRIKEVSKAVLPLPTLRLSYGGGRIPVRIFYFFGLVLLS